MAASKQKLYNNHEIDTREFLQTYFSTDGKNPFADETVYFQMKKLHDSLAAGHFKGNCVYDFSIGSIVHQLFIVCEFYKEITILKLNETCIMELNKWLSTCTGAFDWNIAQQYAKKLNGPTDCQGKINKEDLLKNSVKKILKFDLQKDNLTDPVVLEQADCVISAWLLDVVCRDKNDYVTYFRKMTKPLKAGGLLIVWGVLNTTYYRVGKEKYQVFYYDEMFLRNILANEGFRIHTCEVLDSKIQTHFTDYKQLICVTAVKGTA